MKLLKYAGFLHGSVVKNPLTNVGDTGDPSLMPVSGRSSGGENDNSLQCSYLENPNDRGAWWDTAHGITKSWAHRHANYNMPQFVHNHTSMFTVMFPCYSVLNKFES